MSTPLPRQIIAQAIKQADNSYFNEDYDKQALAVLQALKRQGYAILPRQPNDDLLQAGIDGIPYGQSRPEKIVLGIYSAVLTAVEK